MSGSVKRIVYGVLAVLAAIMFVPQMCSTRHRSAGEAYNQDQYVKPNESRIRMALHEFLAERLDPACIRTVRFPFDSSEHAGPCNNCDTLVEAGLLDRSVATVLRQDQPVTAVRYELTAAARPLYSENLRDRTDGNLAGLCFGRSVLDDLQLSVPAMMQTREIAVRYVTRIENPHDILYGPHARALGLPELTHGHLDGTRQPPQHLTARLDANGAFESLY